MIPALPGIYVLRNSRGDSYVGGTINLKQRFSLHRSKVKHRSCTAQPKFLAAFTDANDLHIEVLELVTPPELPCGWTPRLWAARRLIRRSIGPQIRQRERHWIRTIRPNVNTKLIEPEEQTAGVK